MEKLKDIGDKMKYLVIIDDYRYKPEERKLVFYDADTIYCMVKFIFKHCKNKLEKLYNLTSKREKYKDNVLFKKKFYYTTTTFMWLLKIEQSHVYFEKLVNEDELAVSSFIYELSNEHAGEYFERIMGAYTEEWDKNILELTYEKYLIPDNKTLNKLINSTFFWLDELRIYVVSIKVFNMSECQVFVEGTLLSKIKNLSELKGFNNFDDLVKRTNELV